MNTINLQKAAQKDYVLFTHNDLDGVACAIIFLKCFPTGKVHMLDYRNVDEAITELLVEQYDYNRLQVFITDLAIKQDLADYIETRNVQGHGNIGLIDHHDTSRYLSKYVWALVDTSNAACFHFYQMLSQKFLLQDYGPFIHFASEYDTWGKPYGLNEPSEKAKELSKLVYILGQDRFISRWVQESNIEFSPVERTVLMLEKEREERYLQESLGMVTHLVDAEGVSYGLIPADQYHSVLGHFLLDKFPQHEYVVMIDFRSEKASLRGRGNVHLGEMAEKVGGGGHKKAAGFQLSDSAAKLFINCKDCIHANPENITEEA